MSTDYEPAELAAKAAWDALTPEPGTILWYEKWFADNTMDIPSTNSGWHYRTLMATLKEWAEERAEPDTDASWLESYKEQYEEALIATFEFQVAVEAEIAAKKAAQTTLQGKCAEAGVGAGHAIMGWFYGEYQETESVLLGVVAS